MWIIILITEKYLVDNSVESYYLDIKCYLEYLDKDYKDISREDIKDYLKFLNNSNYSKSSTDRKITSIKTFHHYLYRYYSIKDISKNIERSKKTRKLPNILAIEEIEILLNFELKTSFEKNE